MASPITDAERRKIADVMQNINIEAALRDGLKTTVSAFLSALDAARAEGFREGQSSAAGDRS